MCLALESFAKRWYEEKGRNIRISVDGFQWVYQIQTSSARWQNPSYSDLGKFVKTAIDKIRAFVCLGIGLVVVFDGTDKPVEKREGRFIDSPREVNYLKALCRYVGIPTVEAPGEGEAECAMLQKEGFVDYVFSNDSDAFLTGTTRVVMYYDGGNDNSRRARDRTVWSIDLENDEKVPDMSRADFILCGLLVGGDYDTQGNKGIGIGLAREICQANTRFGAEFREFMGLKEGTRDSPEDLIVVDEVKKQQWLDRLRQELRTNESKYFTTKHPSVQISDSFPNPRTVQYYLQPVVNSELTDHDLFPIPDPRRLHEFVSKTLPAMSWMTFANIFCEPFLVRKIINGSENRDSFTIHSKWRDTTSYRVRFLDHEDILSMEMPNAHQHFEHDTVEDKPIPGYILQQAKSNPIQAYTDRLEAEQFMDRSRKPRIEDFFGHSMGATKKAGSKPASLEPKEGSAEPVNYVPVGPTLTKRTQASRSSLADRSKQRKRVSARDRKLQSRQSGRDKSLTEFFKATKLTSESSIDGQQDGDTDVDEDPTPTERTLTF
ncbi:hypothetical protein TRICI_002253 [Trichomonascus ciferrii]|uniref:XPG-I domain-containing protein n=1 Tax=Trichomonascus ciferrii TaxID=44093 RepID=A0A642V6B6_9ASCO|nr:hypothetical protein TRICI_002253 [Trichomonascus ciferrii]